MSGLRSASTATLLAIRANLLAGLDRVADALAAGMFETVGPKGRAPASQSGHVTLALLHAVDAELGTRSDPPHAKPEHRGDCMTMDAERSH